MNKIKDLFSTIAVISLLLFFFGSQFYISGTIATIESNIFKKVVGFFKTENKVKKSNTAALCEQVNKSGAEKIKNDSSLGLSSIHCEAVDDESIKMNQISIIDKDFLNEERSKQIQIEMKKKSCIIFGSEQLNIRFPNLKIKNNIYDKNDELLFYYNTSKVICADEKFALESGNSD